ncbi:MAG TPA: MotA/TolQ/ExbB proton channel family protein [Oligoflexia bacterium]|nr:MotA/TolQ/ExbB proton channel family protein [Oligoflexia bacterium]
MLAAKTQGAVAAVFKAGYKELKKISQIDARNVRTESIANIHRALGRTALAETHGLEKMVGFLATIGSAAPFVGLFGTVWGIMNSFQGIGATGNANLAVVAPGISEALIATAAGLAAAIPSVMAYNYFVGRIKSIATEMDTFSQDFLNIVQRSMLKSNSAPTVNAQQ